MLMEALPARDTGQVRGKAQDAGWRGSPEGWLEAAYEALKESGIHAVRVMPLAKRLGHVWRANRIGDNRAAMTR